MRALVTGVCVSEFGWELLEWQGYLRSISSSFAKIVISSTDGLFPLYADMHPIFIPHRICGSRDCHRLRSGTIKNPDELVRVRGEIDKVVKQLSFEGYKVKQISAGARYPIASQKFVKYGCAQNIASYDRFAIVIHARNCQENHPFGGSNYPEELWDVLIAQMYRRLGGVTIAAIGTKEASLAPRGVADYRGVPLMEVMDLMASAKLVIGPSSGPMHLASLCGTPHVVWCTDKNQPAIANTNYKRYTSAWNPFGTPVEVVLHRKGVPPSPNQLVESIVRMSRIRGI
jgi:hypothetical protein